MYRAYKMAVLKERTLLEESLRNRETVPITNGGSISPKPIKPITNGRASPAPLVNGRSTPNKPASGRRGGSKPQSPRGSKPPSPLPGASRGSKPPSPKPDSPYHAEAPKPLSPAPRADTTTGGGSRRGSRGSRTATPSSDAPVQPATAANTRAAPAEPRGDTPTGRGSRRGSRGSRTVTPSSDAPIQPASAGSTRAAPAAPPAEVATTAASSTEETAVAVAAEDKPVDERRRRRLAVSDTIGESPRPSENRSETSGRVQPSAPAPPPSPPPPEVPPASTAPKPERETKPDPERKPESATERPDRPDPPTEAPVAEPESKPSPILAPILAPVTHSRPNTLPPISAPNAQLPDSITAASSALKVRDLDLNIEANAREHHTNKYELTEVPPPWRSNHSADVALVVRRGQELQIDVTFDDDFNKKDDQIILSFEPYDLRGCDINIEVNGKGENGWQAEISKDKKKTLDIKVTIPPVAIIAKYKIVVETSSKGKKNKYTHKQPLYLLCNPWCKDDGVFMENDTERSEYILNDTGRVYRGSYKKIRAKTWNFGQFEDFMLDAVFYLLSKSKVAEDKERGDAVLLARTISQIANQSNDNGVLIGNWSGDYSGGTSPLKWTGSVKILEQYWKTKQPVKYGQCWVFSALITTMCRCIGIPARSVTNFASAHDTDGSVTIDSYYDTDGNPLSNSDSVWNFHVWNDVWMTRPDLEPGFGGWQALDGTPQEASPDEPGKYLYVCGPMSLAALKRGNLNMKYDARFIFAEFNADRIKWEKDGDDKKPIQVVQSSVGKFMSTKAVGRNVRMDVTKDYKFDENTEEERATVLRAVEQGAKSHKVEEIYNTSEDVVIELEESDDTDYTPLGEAFNAEIKLSNTSSEKRVADVTLTTMLAWYNGKPADLIKKQKYDVELDPNENKKVKMTVEADDYVNKLVDMCFIKVCCMVRVRETNQIYFDDYMFQFDKPQLTVEAPSTVSLGDEYEVKVSFKNPFPYPLTKCVFTIEGAGHLRLTEMEHKDIPSGDEASVTHKVRSAHLGEREIVAGFDSFELSDLIGEADVVVQKEASPPSPAAGAPAVPPPSKAISAKFVDLNLATNTDAHHTDKYDLVEPDNGGPPTLVVRRGQAFELTVVFDRDYVGTFDDVTFIFDAEDIREKHTEALASAEFEEGNLWTVKLGKVKGNEVTFHLLSHQQSLVAKYDVQIVGSLKDGGEKQSYTLPRPIYLICNPWCNDDEVFMENEDERQEYVLNDVGYVYKGHADQPRANPWNFGQFEEDILDVAMYLMGQSWCMRALERGSAVKLARSISQTSNASDEGGVLAGKWGGGYDDGTPPLAWNGSVAILHEYWQTKTPVKYGQCWVFSAVVTTLCRAIGIPCRSVTNYASAHDTDASMTIDKVYSVDGTLIESNDSVWNFHVWNDAWMARYDLEPGFGGWQAIDGTPQEASTEVSREDGRGLMVCGPASLNALKRGMVSMDFDAKFIFAEFNADRVTWTQISEGERKAVKVSKSSVGKSMSTKAVGSRSRMDVTDQYKYPEGSTEERATVIRAVEQGSLKHTVPDIYDQVEDITFDIDELGREHPLGQDLDVDLQVINKADEPRSIDVTMTAQLIWYNGVTQGDLKKQEFDATCGGKESKTLTMKIAVEEYADKLIDMCFIKVSCMARVKETNQVYFDSFTFMLEKPGLKIEAPTKAKKGEMYEVKVSFVNPLPYPLTKCVFSLEGAGHVKPVTVQQDDIPAGGNATMVTKVKSRKPGKKELVAGFDSVELSDLYGEFDITIE